MPSAVPASRTKRVALALAITLAAPIALHVVSAALHGELPKWRCPPTVEEWAARGVVTYRCIDVMHSYELRCSLFHRLCELETQDDAVRELLEESAILFVVLVLAGEVSARRRRVT